MRHVLAVLFLVLLLSLWNFWQDDFFTADVSAFRHVYYIEWGLDYSNFFTDLECN